MSDKLSPKDFDSITDWMKQYIIGNIKGTLSNPVIAVKSNTYNELIYTINNPNEVDAYFNGELISAKGQSELTHVWNEDSFTISGKLTAKQYKDSEIVSLNVERAPDKLKLSGTIKTKYEIFRGAYDVSTGIYYGYNLVSYGIELIDDSGEIIINSFTPKVDSNKGQMTKTLYDKLHGLYSVGTTDEITLRTSKVVATNNFIILTSNIYVTFLESYDGETYSITNEYYYGYNKTTGSSASWDKTSSNILSIPFIGTLNYTLNGEKVEKEVDTSIEIDIKAWTGFQIYTTGITSLGKITLEI